MPQVVTREVPVERIVQKLVTVTVDRLVEVPPRPRLAGLGLLSPAVPLWTAPPDLSDRPLVFFSRGLFLAKVVR